MKYLFLIFGLFVLFQLGFIWVLLGLGCLVIYGGLEFLMWLDKDDRKIREEKELIEKYSKRSLNKRNVETESEEERPYKRKTVSRTQNK